MITISNLAMQFGGSVLFKQVDLQFTPGSCYGIIGANGAGKSTFLKLLSGELEPTSGEIFIKPGARMSVLKQDQNQYDAYTILDTVIMGNQHLYDVMKEKDALYEKPDFSEEDGMRASELEAEFADMDGWEAESDASKLLQGLGIGTPQPVGYYNIRSVLGLRFDRSYFVTLQSDCTHRYEALFEQHFSYEADVLRAIGRLTAKLHENGLAHKDYGRANILFKQQPDGTIKLELVDLNRMAVGPLDIQAGCKNFERLPATPQMHRWMAETYAEARHFDVEECFKLMEAFRATQGGKIDGKY